MTTHVKPPAKNHDEVLTRAAEELEMPPSAYGRAIDRYKAIGKWLDRSNSTIARMQPAISPQGSFLLGTTIRPLNDGDEYDVDLVCSLQAKRTEISQKDLKNLVGVEIQSYAEAHSMQKPFNGRRCWRLDYADSEMFHMDILPAIPDADRFRTALREGGYLELAHSEKLTQGAISITDDTHPSYDAITPYWHQSNPSGYSEWFKSKMLVQLNERKIELASRDPVRASVADIPDYEVKTTLQRAIQLLKRHRDSLFQEQPEEKPISIIITTLAAKCYKNSPSITESLEVILRDMDSHIENRNGVWWVANPVNPAENFADKWAENRVKEKNFHMWLNHAREDFGLYLHGGSFDRPPIQLEERLGSRVLTAAIQPGSSRVAAAPAVGRQSEREEAEARTRALVSERKASGVPSKPWKK